jgi:hypothetical protein
LTIREYGEMRQLRAAGICGRVIPQIHFAVLAVDPSAQEASPALDRLLLAAAQAEPDPLPLLCLRCRVSHRLEAWLRATHRAHHKSHGLDLLAMASYALDDYGALTIRHGAREKAPFTYAEIASRPPGLISPFTAEVIRTYDPSRCGLPHWARLKIQAHNGLKAYLRENGVLLISDWALLRHTSVVRTKEACVFFGPSELALEQCLMLKRSYDDLYDQAKQAYKQRTGKGAGWAPDQAFLERIAPGRNPFVTSEQLLAIASAIRQLLTGKLQTSLTNADGEELDLPEPAASAAVADHEGISPAEQLALIDAALTRALDQHMPAVLDTHGKNPALMRCLWGGWAEGLTNRPLAERCGTTCGTVSKKLRPSEHATVVATAAALELKRHHAFASCGQSVEAAERLVDALRNHLLTPKREGDVAPLRQWIQHAMSQP